MVPIDSGNAAAEAVKCSFNVPYANPTSHQRAHLLKQAKKHDRLLYFLNNCQCFPYFLWFVCLTGGIEENF